MSETPSPTDATDAPERPVLRIVRGTPDAVEVAALVAVVAAASGGGEEPAPSTGSRWAAPDRTVRGTLPSGGWRTSFAPR